MAFQYYTDVKLFLKYYHSRSKMKLDINYILSNPELMQRVEQLMHEENEKRRQTLYDLGIDYKERWTELGLQNLEIIHSSEELTAKRIKNLKEAAQNPEGFHKTKAWENAKNTWQDPKRIAAAAEGSGEITACPHCGEPGGKSGMKSWHFDYCPKNPNRKMRGGRNKGITNKAPKAPKSSYLDEVYKLLPNEFKVSEARDIVSSFGKHPNNANAYLQNSDKFEKVSRAIYRKK